MASADTKAPVEYRCPKCGNSQVSSMEELLNLVSTPSSQFSSDLASWLLPPQRPRRPLSRRHKTGIRNGIAFGLVWLIVLTVACFAFTHGLPNIPFALLSISIALVIGTRTWKAESKLAAKEDKLLLETHWERYRAYLQRRRVWSRLRYCAKCGLVADPATQQTTTLFDIHEIANGKSRGSGG